MLYFLERSDESQSNCSPSIHPRSRSNFILQNGPGSSRRTVKGNVPSSLQSSVCDSRYKLAIFSEGVFGSPCLSRS